MSKLKSTKLHVLVEKNWISMCIVLVGDSISLTSHGLKPLKQLNFTIRDLFLLDLGHSQMSLPIEMVIK